MSEVRYFAQDSNMVKIMVAEARHESIDSDQREKAHSKIMELFAHPSPENRYAVAEIIGFGVNEIRRTAENNWLPNIADVKVVNFGVHPQFQCRLEGVRAYHQAKGSTTERSKIANKAMILSTELITCRPSINIVEAQNGQVDMGALINDAAYQMELEELKYYQEVLLAGVGSTFRSPYYGYGPDVDKQVFDPMLRHWMRMSNGAAPAILGDVEEIHKVVELTGFTADPTTGAKQFNDGIIGDFYRTGRLGNYLGASVINLMNPVVDGTDEFVFNRKFVFILPTFIDPTMRPLKVVKEGGIQRMEATDIDDRSFDVCLDEYVGAALVTGDRPYLSIYEDKSL